MSHHDFSGIWRSSHYKAEGGPVTNYYVTLSLDGDELRIQSLANSDNSQMTAHFKLEGDVATGNYQSHNAPNTAARDPLFEALYYGAAQLVLDADSRVFSGKGVGFSKSGKVQLTNWEIVYSGKNLNEVSQSQGK